MELITAPIDPVWCAAQSIVVEEGRLLDEMNQAEQAQFFLEIAHRTELPESEVRNRFLEVANDVTLLRAS